MLALIEDEAPWFRSASFLDDLLLWFSLHGDGGPETTRWSWSSVSVPFERSTLA